MRKQWLLVGVIVLIFGVIIALQSFTYSVSSGEKVVNYAENSWEVSANLTRGEDIRIRLRFPQEWWTVAEQAEEGNIKLKIFKLEVIDAKNRTTTFLVFLGRVDSKSYGTAVGYYNLSVQENEGALIVNSTPKEIGGITTITGTYTVRFKKQNGYPIVYPPVIEPPLYFGIVRRYREESVSFSYFFPVGLAICFSGVFMVTYSCTPFKGKNKERNIPKKLAKMKRKRLIKNSS